MSDEDHLAAVRYGTSSSLGVGGSSGKESRNQKSLTPIESKLKGASIASQNVGGSSSQPKSQQQQQQSHQQQQQHHQQPHGAKKPAGGGAGAASTPKPETADAKKHRTKTFDKHHQKDKATRKFATANAGF